MWMLTVPLLLGAFAQVQGFQIGGYLENWVSPYVGYEKFNVVYYSFLTLDPQPNPDAPPARRWNGQAIYETMTLAPIGEVMTRTTPDWDNDHNWQRVKIQAVIDYCKSVGTKFIWAIGGWSDLTLTIYDEQIELFASMVVDMLQYGGDGIDFDWEHLSWPSDASVRLQQRAIVGKTAKAIRRHLDAAGMHDKTISYTSRFNCFWQSADAHQFNAKMFPSDGECLDTFEHCNVSDIDWVNLMMYDAYPGSAFNGRQYFTPHEYRTVLEAGSRLLPKEKIVMGFEPGYQAVSGIWEGFDIDFEVIQWMKDEGYGGIMFWAINEAASVRNPGTPISMAHQWQGNTGLNSQYIAVEVARNDRFTTTSTVTTTTTTTTTALSTATESTTTTTVTTYTGSTTTTVTTTAVLDLNTTSTTTSTVTTTTTTEMSTLIPTGPCHAIESHFSDTWCNANCGHDPPFCPPEGCACD